MNFFILKQNNNKTDRCLKHICISDLSNPFEDWEVCLAIEIVRAGKALCLGFVFSVAVMAFGVPDRLHPPIAKKRFQRLSLISANVKSLRIRSLFPQLFL